VTGRFRCPVCERVEAEVFLELAGMPALCNVLYETREQAAAAATGDIRLAACPPCGHVFNAAFEPARVLYGPGYENSLHFSARFQQHADALARELTERHDLRGRLVVELGCGRGDFLVSLCRRAGCRGIGLDPSFPGDEGRVDPAVDVTIRRESFGGLAPDLGADLACCRHCLEHVAEPLELLRALRQGLGDARSVAVCFEVPNVLATLRDGAIWDILYEHCGYFSPSSLALAFHRTGFEQVEVDEAFEGQFLVLHGRSGSRPEGPPGPREPGAAQVSEHVRRFGQLYRDKTSAWRARLARDAAAGRRVVTWGAGSKGATFLNLLGRGGAVTHAVDVNPRKHGRFVAGTGHEIVSPESLREIRPDVVVAMNPVYRDEIASTLRRLGLRPELLAG